MKNCSSVSTSMKKDMKLVKGSEGRKIFWIDYSKLMKRDIKLVKGPEGRKVGNTLYKKIMGSLIYLMAIRPDVVHIVTLIIKYLESSKEMHLQATKRILWYLNDTSSF